MLNKLKKEIIYLVIMFFISLIVFQIVLYKETFLVNLRIVASFFWIFLLPGWALMLNWYEKLSFLERTLIGIAVAVSIVGISSYYIGIMGLHIKYHIYFPAVIILVAFVLIRKKLMSKE